MLAMGKGISPLSHLDSKTTFPTLAWGAENYYYYYYCYCYYCYCYYCCY